MNNDFFNLIEAKGMMDREIHATIFLDQTTLISLLICCMSRFRVSLGSVELL